MVKMRRELPSSKTKGHTTPKMRDDVRKLEKSFMLRASCECVSSLRQGKHDKELAVLALLQL
jgi:hypothetical protein